jgi:DivIVA domain-containing protein
VPDPSERSDALAAGGLADAEFRVVRKGYEPAEVREYLRLVAAETARLREREAFLERELESVRTRGLSDPGVLDEATVVRLVGEEVARVLVAAREAAQQMRARAADSADRVMREASHEATRVRQDLEVELSRRRGEAGGDGEAEVELAKAQGREIVREARAYRERLFTELAERRELVRRQIEQLIRDRDRLMGAFERARLAANDVVGDLGEFDDATFGADTTRRREPSPASAHPENVVPFDREQFEEDEPPVAPSVTEVPTTLVAAATPTVDPPARSTVDAPAPSTVDAPAPPTELPARRRGSGGGDGGGCGEPPQFPDLGAPSRSNVIPLFGDDARRMHPSHAPAESRRSAVNDLFKKLREGGPASVVATRPAARRRGPAPAAPRVVEPATADPSVFAARETAIAPFVAALSRAAKRTLVDEESALLAAVQATRGAPDVAASLPVLEIQVQAYVEAVREPAVDSALAGAIAFSSGLRADVRAKVAASEVVRVVSRRVEQDVVQPIREQLVTAARAAGEDAARFAVDLRDVYREWKVRRMELVAADLARLAYARGAFLALPAGTRVCWVADPDGPECAEALDNSLAGSQRVGECFPTGDEHPTAHAGCRCMVIPTPH